MNILHQVILKKISYQNNHRLVELLASSRLDIKAAHEVRSLKSKPPIFSLAGADDQSSLYGEITMTNLRRIGRSV
ncbi:MAG: hypothetical protein AB7E55_13190, partial [Pigmentiphaga sp.]